MAAGIAVALLTFDKIGGWGAMMALDQAGEHNQIAIRRTDLATALAEAMSAREESNRKLAALQLRQSELQTASLVNWSDKLATFRSSRNVDSLTNPTLETTTVTPTMNWEPVK